MIQDPSKPKASKKRKERAAEKVAHIEKVVVKACAEREKAKRAKSVEVNNPSARHGGPAQPTEECDVSLHSSDLADREPLIYSALASLSSD